jgi:hypothetical protein
MEEDGTMTTSSRRLIERLAEAYRRRPRRAIIAGVALIFVVSAALYVWLAGLPAKAPTTALSTAKRQVFVGGRYAELAPGQKRLVDDWVDRFSKVMARPMDASGLYDGLALSTRTTFSAVTHALLDTELTDKSGAPTNETALDLVAKLETVAGKIPGAGGDRQFRIYVEMRPDAREILEKSREFSRRADNTVFHKGYPVCFRSATDVPSIQVSLSRDGRRGDLDVDYRSSSFPILLVNGHLTASNSDIRAGDNDQRHNQRWPGLRNWWRSFLGLPALEAPRVDETLTATAVAREPRLKDVKPEEAIHDFLSSWLVEKRPDVAVGYVSPRAFACLEVERGEPLDRGMARFQILRALQRVNTQLGAIRDLSEAIEGVSLTGPRGKVIAQPHHAQFVMYDVREDLVSQMDCATRLNPEEPALARADSTAFGKFVGAVFRLKTPQTKGATVATIWAAEKGTWTLVAYDVEPEAEPGAVPNTMPATGAPATPALPVVRGDPAMNRAAKGFLEAWFLRKDAVAVSRYLSPKCYPCYNVYRPEEAPAAGSPDEAGKLLRERIKLFADWVGPAKDLDEVLVAPEPHQQDLKLVKHDQSRAFAIVSLPESMGTAADCAQLRRGDPLPLDARGSMAHGRFYAVGARIKKGGEDAAVLWMVWAKDPEWKVVSYHVITP